MNNPSFSAPQDENLHETKRMSSIAMRINILSVMHIILAMLIINISFMGVSFGVWCLRQQSMYHDDYTLSADFKGDGNLIENIEYVSSDKSHSIPVIDFAKDIAYTMMIVTIIELIIILWEIKNGLKRVRSQLKPINDIAFTAERMSVYADKFHVLEDAICKISPSAEDFHVSTGHEELQGLETAINNFTNRMKDSYQQQLRFVSDASHELRTPISVIKGYADMLRRWGKDDAEVLEESINALSNEADNMQKLVEQLLFLARGDSGRNRLASEYIDISDVTRELFEEYSLIDETHLLKISLSDREVFTYGDRCMLKQSMRILIDNARKYTPENREITFRTFINDYDESCFEVQDNGIGIKSEDIPHIFERFFRSDPSRNHKDGGSGLGLSIAKWIVDAHHGYFDVVSCIDIGTKITICLPKNDISLLDDVKHYTD